MDHDLDQEDPLLVLAEQIESSGMPPKAASALGAYCRMPAGSRSLRALRQQLGKNEEWGGQPPDHATIERWSSSYSWSALLVSYDTALLRLRTHEDERRRREHTESLLADARSLRIHARAQAEKMIDAYNEPLGDPSTWPVNPRTGQPIPPRRTLAGLQAVAALFKEAVYSERLALGMPTSISDSKVQAAVETTTTTTISVEQWREHTRNERELAAAGHVPRALPAPQYSVRQELPDTLTPEEAEALPDDWFEDDGVANE